MSRLKTAANLLLATLQEIFDEASYRRFLERTGLTSSPEAYESFWREREDAQSRRTRCC
jgi:hypothetical protein